MMKNGGKLKKILESALAVLIALAAWHLVSVAVANDICSPFFCHF